MTKESKLFMTKESKLFRKRIELIEALQKFEHGEVYKLKEIIDWFYKRLEHKNLSND